MWEPTSIRKLCIRKHEWAECRKLIHEEDKEGFQLSMCKLNFTQWRISKSTYTLRIPIGCIICCSLTWLNNTYFKIEKKTPARIKAKRRSTNLLWGSNIKWNFFHLLHCSVHVCMYQMNVIDICKRAARSCLTCGNSFLSTLCSTRQEMRNYFFYNHTCISRLYCIWYRVWYCSFLYHVLLCSCWYYVCCLLERRGQKGMCCGIFQEY